MAVYIRQQRCMRIYSMNSLVLETRSEKKEQMAVLGEKRELFEK